MTSKWKAALSRFAKDESGATVIEYALIASIIFIGIISVLGDIADELNATFGEVAKGFQK